MADKNNIADKNKILGKENIEDLAILLPGRKFQRKAQNSYSHKRLKKYLF